MPVRSEFIISGVGGQPLERVSMKARLTLHLPDRHIPLEFDALCVRYLGLSTPASPVADCTRSLWPGLELADPHFDTPGDIELLLGANVLPEILRPGLLRRADLMAQRTAAGWTISGRAPQTHDAAELATCLALQSDVEPQWHQQLMAAFQRFWEVEEGPRYIRKSPEDEACERLFREHWRAPDGRYVLRLPVKPDALALLDHGLGGAYAALRSLQRRLSQDPLLAAEYTRFMRDYLRLGHMRVVPPATRRSSAEILYYITHHPIWQRGDLERKLRVVFNASRRSNHGCSLNEILYTGPKLQTSVWNVLIRWRRHRVAFCTDIKMMYRQIRIDERDVDLQRIVWSPHEDEAPVHYQLLTVTYGVSCAPYLSLRALEQLCADEGGKFPDAVQALLRDRYVDDILTGAATVEAALVLRDQLIKLLNAGGFPLGKWVANTPELLEDLPSEDCLRPTWVQLVADGPVNELGIGWNPTDDTFRLTPPRFKEHQRTKREVLAAMASIFDPCGWLAPVVLVAKLLMQDLWRARLEWDEELPASYARRWETIRQGFRDLSGFVLPRWIQTNGSQEAQLHAFSDASRRAMAAVIYIRVSNDVAPAVVNLLASKTKLAPIRSLKPTSTPTPRMTIPRLELRAAVIAAKLLRLLADELDIPLDRCHAWSDSQIVLRWIQSPEPVGNSIVDNYVSHIQELLPISAWHYVPTCSNPADVASRGADLSQLLHRRDWFSGPVWLSGAPCSWPQANAESPINEAHQLRHNVLACALQGHAPDPLDSFSNLNVRLRFMVRFRRWVRLRFARTPTEAVRHPISAQELGIAFVACVQASQRRYFATELQLLRKGTPLPARSPFRGLDLFIGPDDVLRVGGRLHHSDLPYNARHPPVLDGRSHLASLIINWAHQRSLHGGFRSTYVYAIRRAWIVGGKRRIRALINSCVICARARALPLEQKMAALPSERVTPARPFSRVGLDYAGPFQVLATRGRGIRTVKAYVAVFVCFVTKAVHLELVGDMTTESLMGALTRFCGRRGRPAEIWSDNATYFHRADLELRTAFAQAQLNWTRVTESLAEEGIAWRFIPPAAPHFGGLWEAGVKSFKTHLKRTVGPRHLTYEEFTTLLVSIEAVLNCRPITPLSGDPEDLHVLTPGHFLGGDVLTTVPDLIPEPDRLDQLTHWKLVAGMRSQFWHRWSREYLNVLQQRSKWTQSRANLCVGDLVVVLDATLIRSNGKWPLGRIVHVHPGSDGLVRTATVRTASGEYLRPLTKLSRIPLEKTDSSETPTLVQSAGALAGGIDNLSFEERGGRDVGT